MNIALRIMIAADIPAGMQLVDIAGWNQTRSDWERFLAASPEGCFVAEAGGDVVGTVATLSYEGRFAWIGMVLVHPSQRGHGIGTRLLEKAIDYLEASRIPCMKLDATPLGKPLYENLGFLAEYELERWQLLRASAPDISIAPVLLSDDMLNLDRRVFGADRRPQLRSIAAENPQFLLEARHHGKLTGYGLGRQGSVADHLGPWVAEDEDYARNLLDEFLSRSRRQKIFVDAVCASPWALGLLRAHGFTHLRPLTRMFRGSNDFPGQLELQCGILGPEFG